jgi:hypothetical protein
MGTHARGSPLFECFGHGLAPTVIPFAKPHVVCRTQWSLPLILGRRSVKHVSVFTGVVALAGIEESRLEGKHPSDDKELSATVCAVQHGRRVAWRWCGLTRGADVLCHHLPDGVGSDGTTCVQKAAVSDVHEAIGQNMLEEPAEKLNSVERSGS